MASNLDIHMPKTLVVAMERLFCDNGMTSWSITGGKLYSQVTIRFAPDPDQGGSVDTEKRHTKYKRMAPSQVNRDMMRAANRHKDTTIDNNVQQNVLQTDNNDCLKLTDHTVDIHTEADDNIENHNARAISESAQTDDMIDNVGGVTSSGTSTTADSESDTSNQESLCQRTVGDVTCNVCDDVIHNDPMASYYVCAQCSNTKLAGIFVVCKECYSKHEHSSHSAQMTLFTDPVIDHGYFCSQCGHEFKSAKTPVFACAFCQKIEYEICKQCYESKMHSHHRKYFQALTRKDLEARNAAINNK